MTPDSRRRLVAALIAIAGFALVVAAFAPGGMSPDSLDQYAQALARSYDDAHPPLMAWLWSRVALVVPGPLGMLLLHAGLMSLGLWLFADGALARGIRGGMWVPLAGFLPPVMGIEGMIWKDVGLAAALLVAAGIAYRASAGQGRKPGTVAAALSMLALFYALCVRSNAPAAVLPIAIYWIAVFGPRRAAASWRRLAIAGLALVAVMMAVQWGVDSRLLQAKRMHRLQVLQLFDLASIGCAGGQAAIPEAFVRHDPDALPVCEAFHPKSVDPLLNRAVSQTTDRSDLRELGRAWRRAIVAEPGLWLAARWGAYSGALGFDVPRVARLIWPPYTSPNGHGFSLEPSAARDAMGVGVALAESMGLYNGVAWLAVAAWVAWAARRRRGAELALSTSALLYGLALFPVAIAPDYRYVYWSIVAASVGAVLAMAQSPWLARVVRRFRGWWRAEAPTTSLCALALAGWGVTVVAFHPGIVAVDSIWQYAEAIGGHFTDHHPAVVSWTWGLLHRLWPTPVGVVWLHAFLIWAALVLFADGARRRGATGAWRVMLVGWLPPVIGIEGMVWKDIGMTGALGLAAALLYRASAGWRTASWSGAPRGGHGPSTGGPTGNDRLDPRIVALVALLSFYAIVSRANAVIAVMPVLAWGCWLAWPRVRTAGRCAVVTLGASMVFLALGSVIEHRLLDAKRAYLAQYLYVFDLAAIECAGGEARVPRELERGSLDALPLCRSFDARKVDFLFAPSDAALEPTRDRHLVRALRSQWWHAIVANPGIYLAHRMEVFAALMGVPARDELRRPLFMPYSIANPYGFTFAPNSLTHLVAVWVGIGASLALFGGFAWLLLALGTLALAWRGRRMAREGRRVEPAAVVLAGSSVAYALAYFVIAVATDFRYLHWTVFASAVAASVTWVSWPARAAAAWRSPAWQAGAARGAAMVQRDGRISRLLAITGFLLTLIAFYPGLVSSDSIIQYTQVRQASYFDHHPPIMVWVWTMLDRLIPGTFGMLLLHSAMTWVGLWAFADGAARRQLPWPWLPVACGFLPPLFSIAGEIWKDIGMTSALLLGAGWLYRAVAIEASTRDRIARDTRRRGIGAGTALVAFLALYYATLVRTNAPAATLPLWFYWAYATFARARLGAVAAIGVLAMALSMVLQSAFDYGVMGVRHSWVSQYLVAHDLAAAQCEGDATVAWPRVILVHPDDPAGVCRVYDPLQVDFLYLGAAPQVGASGDPAVVKQLRDEWLRVTLDNPGAYFAHRAKVFGAILGFGIDGPRRWFWVPASLTNPYGFGFVPNVVTDAVGVLALGSYALGLYNGLPWIVLAAAVALGGWARRRRGEPEDAMSLALCAGALGYVGAYFFVGVAPDYRYIHAGVAMAAVAAAIVVPAWVKRVIATTPH